MSNISIYKTWITAVTFLVALGSNAQLLPNAIDSNLSITAGFENSTTNFRWSIAGNSQGTNPNIFSEIVFNPIRSSGFHVGAAYTIYDPFAIDFNFEQLYTYKGNATDIDYAGDDRTLPTTELHLKSNKGKQSTLNGRVLYNMVKSSTVFLKAGVGYTYSDRLFYLLNDDDPSLQTTYATKWLGPHLSILGKWQTVSKINVGADVQFSFFDYSAKGNWNLIETFQHPVSFTHAANGSGWNFNVFTGYQLKHIGFTIHWLNSNWSTNDGIDKLYLTNGEVPETQLNGAFEKSSAWRLSATYVF